MTLVLLMSLFQSISDEDLTYPAPPHVVAIIQTLPVRPEFYAQVADAAYAKFMVDAEDDLSFQRFVDIFRVIVFYDGRSELGLLRIAQLAYEHPEAADHGTNALGILANYYRGGSRSAVPQDELLDRLDTYMTNEALFHNARECRNAVRRNP